MFEPLIEKYSARVTPVLRTTADVAQGYALGMLEYLERIAVAVEDPQFTEVRKNYHGSIPVGTTEVIQVPPTESWELGSLAIIPSAALTVRLVNGVGGQFRYVDNITVAKTANVTQVWEGGSSICLTTDQPLEYNLRVKVRHLQARRYPARASGHWELGPEDNSMDQQESTARHSEPIGTGPHVVGATP